MPYTKRQLIDLAFEELGIASYEFDVQAEEYQSALRRLDAMMGSWNASGIRVGYPIPSEPQNSTLDQNTNLPDSANEAVFLNLAVRLAPLYGKNISPDTRSLARSSLDTLRSRVTKALKMQFPNTLPTGQGNRQRGGNMYWNRFFNETDQIDVGPDDVLEY